MRWGISMSGSSGEQEKTVGVGVGVQDRTGRDGSRGWLESGRCGRYLNQRSALQMPERATRMTSLGEGGGRLRSRDRREYPQVVGRVQSARSPH